MHLVTLIMYAKKYSLLPHDLLLYIPFLSNEWEEGGYKKPYQIIT